MDCGQLSSREKGSAKKRRTERGADRGGRRHGASATLTSPLSSEAILLTVHLSFSFFLWKPTFNTRQPDHLKGHPGSGSPASDPNTKVPAELLTGQPSHHRGNETGDAAGPPRGRWETERGSRFTPGVHSQKRQEELVTPKPRSLAGSPEQRGLHGPFRGAAGSPAGRRTHVRSWAGFSERDKLYACPRQCMRMAANRRR